MLPPEKWPGRQERGQLLSLSLVNTGQWSLARAAHHLTPGIQERTGSPAANQGPGWSKLTNHSTDKGAGGGGGVTVSSLPYLAGLRC